MGIGETSYSHDKFAGAQANAHPTETQILVQAAAAVCEEKKGQDTRILELDPVDSGLSDFFLVTSAANDRQAIAIADEIELRLKRDFGAYPNSVEGRRNGEWILLDYVDFVVHVFLAERRAFYDIERLRKSARPLTPAEFDAELKAALAEKTRAVRKKAAAKPKPKKAAASAKAKSAPARKSHGQEEDCTQQSQARKEASEEKVRIGCALGKAGEPWKHRATQKGAPRGAPPFVTGLYLEFDLHRELQRARAALVEGARVANGTQRGIDVRPTVHAVDMVGVRGVCRGKHRRRSLTEVGHVEDVVERHRRRDRSALAKPLQLDRVTDVHVEGAEGRVACADWCVRLCGQRRNDRAQDAQLGLRKQPSRNQRLARGSQPTGILRVEVAMAC